MIELDTLETVQAWLADCSPVLPPRAVQAVNLSSIESQLIQYAFPDSLFLGCTLTDQAAGHIVQTGGVVLPNADGLHFQSHRAKLYHRRELFEGFDPEDPMGYHRTLDYRIYKQYLAQGKDQPPSIHTSLMRRLHDHSITDALEEAIEGAKVVAIMGGHGIERQEEVYQQIAHLSRTLTQDGFLLVSGGGPGIMEATHLGAYFATKSTDDLEKALSMLAPRPVGSLPNKEYDDADWLHRAMKVIDAFPLTVAEEAQSKSIGIPTWLYGHEPPAPFATHIAKYFANSVREDGLLQIARYGVIFAQGSAGTTQEIFQDACQNHYAAYNTDTNNTAYVSPMILLGSAYWQTVRPVWNLLEATAAQRPYGELLALTDSTAEIRHLLHAYRPERYRFPNDI